MTSLPGFSFAGQEAMLPAVFPAPSVSPDAESVPLAEGETPAAFSCVLELCKEPAASASPTPAPAPAPAPLGVDAMLAAAGFPLVTAARSLRLDPVEASVPTPETTEGDEAEGEDVLIAGHDAETPSVVGIVPEELARLAVSPLPLPPPPEPVSTISPTTAPEKSSAKTDVAGVGEKPLQENRLNEAWSAHPSRPLDLARAIPPKIATTMAPAAVVETSGAVAPASLVPPDGHPALVAEPVLATVEKNQVETVSGIPLEKFAAHARPLVGRAVETPPARLENKFLTVDHKSDKAPEKSHGTVNAKSFADMPAIAETPSLQTAPTPARAGVPAPVAPVVDAITPLTPGFSPAPALNPNANMNAEAVVVRREISLPAADAAAVVREVAELTHDFRFHERGSVEVKFNFKDDTELSVRLAYRDGDVHATFRTDSPELRTTLGREWQGYAAQIAQEPRAYRMADPVFTNSNDFSGSPQGRDSGSATGGDARQQQQSFSNPDQSGSARSASPAQGFRQTAAAPAPRVSNDRLLHAFA
jgi:hypothetical protein